MKKAQSEIITTVLLVLIALAAVAIIAMFINNQVRQGAATADAKAQCLKIDLEVTKAVANASGGVIYVKNNGETPADAKVKAIVEGASWGSEVNLPTSLTTTTITVGNDDTKALVKDQKVEIGVLLADKTACPMKTTYTVTAA